VHKGENERSIEGRENSEGKYKRKMAGETEKQRNERVREMHEKIRTES
jgi:hypothetical protein